MRFLYNLLTYLLLIPFACYWLVRGIANRAYLDRLPQRFGFGFPQLERSIWIHAVSVGEVQAAVPVTGGLELELLDGETRQMDSDVIAGRIRDAVGPVPEAQKISFGRVSMFGKPATCMPRSQRISGASTEWLDWSNGTVQKRSRLTAAIC